jgi:galactonate dehydratase
MKITGIKTYKFNVPTGGTRIDPHTGEALGNTSKDWLFLKIETDTELVGWGEGSGEWLTMPVEATLHDWETLLVGKNPLHISALCDDIANRLPWKGGAVFGTALAAINIALHDLAGKAWGVPVHTLLGGARRQRIRVYRGGDFSTPEKAAAAVRQIQAAGYAGMKGNPLEERTWPMDEKALAHSTAVVAAIRQAAGEQFDIMLDTHGSPQPELSLEFARRVAPYQPLFLEEPCKVGSIDALLAISRHSPVPVATGEKLFEWREFEPLIQQRAVAFLQPDIGHCFGLTHYMEIAKQAEHQQMLMAPHLGVGALLYIASLHADAATNNFLIQESPDIQTFEPYIDHDLTIADGYINLSERPGLGIEVKEADIAKAPHEPMAYRQYRHIDGSWKGW